MKKTLLAIVVISGLVVGSPVSAQQGTGGYLSALGGWKFGGVMNTREGELSVAAAWNYSMELEFRVRPDGTAVISVDYQPSTLRLKTIGVGTTELFDIDVWYFQAGGHYEIIDRGPVVPYGLGLLGAAWFNPGGGSRAESEWALAGTFGGGARIPLGASGKVNLRLEGRINITIPWWGGSLYCGGGGCYSSVGGTVGPVQAGVLAGLAFAIGGGGGGRARR